MNKYVAIISYKGSNYCGWQKQPNNKTVQELVEKSLSTVANHKINIVCAGRTDSGVHANAQVIHFLSPSSRSFSQWLRGGNLHLPIDIRIMHVDKINEDFHARFSAISRRYRYRIYNSEVQNVFVRENCLWIRQKIDLDIMQRAGNMWLGYHDFSSFRDSQCQASTPYRRLLHFQVIRCGNFILVDIVANAFLHHMVRNMIGVLVPIATNKKPLSWAKEVLDAKSRKAAGITALACGLSLQQVYYLPEYQEKIRAVEDVLAQSCFFEYY